jgi:CRISPR/Cas system-associated exonuclease Cas4 (RecB family)
MEQKLEIVLAQFDKIDLNGLEEFKLLSRFDTKYVFPLSALQKLLEVMKDDYFLLEINDLHNFYYETIYYDSPEFFLYNEHHKGKLNRFKIRRRHYVYNNEKFFEIKQKIKGNKTHKFRVAQSGDGNAFSDIEKEMLNFSGAPKIALEEKLKVHYTRLTLAAKNDNQRITIDLGLTYLNKENETKSLQQLVILEVKQNSTNRNNTVMHYLKSKRIRPLSISKYAIGIALTEKHVKINTFKYTILQINKLLINA